MNPMPVYDKRQKEEDDSVVFTVAMKFYWPLQYSCNFS